MKSIFRSFWEKSSFGFIGKLTVFAIVLAQLSLVCLLQTRTVINLDGIFSYTLANNPYGYNFIDSVYDEFPNNNGWIDTHILRENYIVEEYDRFNYSAVYYHQKGDVHPPLYYFILHTISSLFLGTYSNMYVLSINLAALLLIDFFLYKLFMLLYHKACYVLIPLMLLMSMETMKFLYTWARMYMMLFLFCTWYLYIHALLIRKGNWKKTYLLQMICCIFLGTLTHYYFYIYAASLSLMTIIFLTYKRQRYKLWNYLYSGIIGLASSWIFFPWVMWQIFDNPQQKHTNITPWSLEKIKGYLAFLNERLFDGRGWQAVFVLVIAGLWLFVLRRWNREYADTEHSIFRYMIFGSGMLYSLVIYTLDGGGAALYYSTALYMAFVVWFSMILIDSLKNIKLFRQREVLIIITAVACLTVLYSTSTLERYVKNAKEVVSRIRHHESLQDGIRRVSEEYKGADCIYVEAVKDNLLHNYWFEFGEYDEFKKLSLEDFEQYGISKETLIGRTSFQGDDILVYVPVECIFEETDYKLIVSGGEYNVFQLICGEEE